MQKAQNHKKLLMKMYRGHFFGKNYYFIHKMTKYTKMVMLRKKFFDLNFLAIRAHHENKGAL